MRASIYLTLSFALAIEVLSGCSGSDTGPILPPSGSAASTADQRTPQSDALTSQEAALASQADSEPVPAPKSES